MQNLEDGRTQILGDSGPQLASRRGLGPGRSCTEHGARALQSKRNEGRVQAERSISTPQLHVLPRFHLAPIHVVVFDGPSGRSRLEGGFPLQMLSAVIPSACRYPAMPLARQPVHEGCVHPGPLVLGAIPLTSPAPTADRDRTVSRRSEPSSRTTLIGEQPNPWDLLQPQDVMSRHRGAKPPRRYGLLGEISLLSPEYLLSDERRPFHSESAGSLGPTFVSARAISLAVRHTSTLTLYARLLTALSVPSRSSVTF